LTYIAFRLHGKVYTYISVSFAKGIVKALLADIYKTGYQFRKSQF